MFNWKILKKMINDKAAHMQFVFYHLKMKKKANGTQSSSWNFEKKYIYICKIKKIVVVIQFIWKHPNCEQIYLFIFI